MLGNHINPMVKWCWPDQTRTCEKQKWKIDWTPKNVCQRGQRIRIGILRTGISGAFKIWGPCPSLCPTFLGCGEGDQLLCVSLSFISFLSDPSPIILSTLVTSLTRSCCCNLNDVTLSFWRYQIKISWCFWCWCWGTCWGQFGRDFEAEAWIWNLNFSQDIEAGVWSRFWSQLFVKTLSLRCGQDFEGEVWSRFWSWGKIWSRLLILSCNMTF